MVYYNMEAEVLSLITFLHSVYCTLGSKEWNNGMATKCTTVKAVTEITRPLFIYVCVHRHEAHALYFCKTQGQVLFSHIQSVFIYNKQLVRVGKRSYFSPPTWLEMSQCLTETIQQVWMLKSCLESQWHQTYTKTGSTGRWSKVTDQESVDSWRKVKKSRQFYLYSSKSQITSAQWALKCVQWM